MMDRPAGRLVSLDALRGLAVMGMILVNASAGMFYDNRAAVFATLLHEHWEGLHVADVVFPAFLMMVGVAVPMSLDRAKRGGGLDRATAGRIAGRVGRLFLIGLLLSNLHWLARFDTGAWRFWGVLQRIGLVYGACAVLFLATGRRTWLAVIAAVLVAYWPLLLVPQPDGQPTDLWVRGLNFAGWADRATLGAGRHIYVPGPQGYDPEGLLGTLPAIAHGLIGVVVGDRLRRRPGPATARALVLAGAVLAAAGLAWGLVFPIVKDLWSSSFVLVTCGLTAALLGVLHAAMDGAAPRRVRWPETVAHAFGGNAIAAYVLHELTPFLLTWDVLLLPYRRALGWMPPPLASLVPIALYLAGIGWAMLWLRRRGWVIKV